MGVHENEVTDPTTIPQIGLKYPELRPTPVLPVDEALEPEVEDESLGTNTTEEEGSLPTANVDDGELPNLSEDSKDDVAEPAARRPGGLFASFVENIAGTGQSKEAAKKRKNATTEKTTQRSNKQTTRASPPEVPPQVDPTTGASMNHGNDPPDKSTEGNAVTPARLA